MTVEPAGKRGAPYLGYLEELDSKQSKPSEQSEQMSVAAVEGVAARAFSNPLPPLLPERHPSLERTPTLLTPLLTPQSVQNIVGPSRSDVFCKDCGSRVSLEELISLCQHEIRGQEGRVTWEQLKAYAAVFEDLKGNENLKQQAFIGVKEITALCLAAPFNEAAFKSIIQTCSNLQTVQIYQNSDFIGDEMDRTVAVLGRCCPTIQEISLVDCNKITGSGIAVLATHCPGLQKINLSGCEGVSDEGIQALAHCRELREINLDFCYKVTAPAIQALVQQCNQLQRVCFHSSAVKDETIFELSVHCKQIQYVAIGDCASITEEGIIAFLKQLAEQRTELRGLDVDGCDEQVTDSVLQVLAITYPNLRCISLNACSEITSEGIDALTRNCSQLEEIALDECPQISGREIQALAVNNPNLQVLDIDGCIDITNDEILSIGKNCKQLQSLAFCRTKQMTDEGIRAFLSECSQLQELRFYGGTDADAQAIGAHCLQLQHLYLLVMQNFTDVGMQAIAEGCKRLRTFEFKCFPTLTSNGFRAILWECEQLQQVRLIDPLRDELEEIQKIASEKRADGRTWPQVTVK